MPYYQKLGEMPRKHHIWFHRNGATPTFKNEGIAYEHVITTEGFNEAYSIMYHLRPPTRVRSVKLLKCEELKKAANSPLRHHHLRTANIARKGDLYSGRIPILFNQDMTAWRARPEKPYGKFEYYKNGGADEIIFVFKGGGTVETIFGKQRRRRLFNSGIGRSGANSKTLHERRRPDQNGIAIFRARFSRTERAECD